MVYFIIFRIYITITDEKEYLNQINNQKEDQKEDQKDDLKDDQKK